MRAATPCGAPSRSPRRGSPRGSSSGCASASTATLAADFATAGVSHVVAISGWNIAIVAALVGGRRSVAGRGGS